MGLGKYFKARLQHADRRVYDPAKNMSTRRDLLTDKKQKTITYPQIMTMDTKTDEGTETYDSEYSTVSKTSKKEAKASHKQQAKHKKLADKNAKLADKEAAKTKKATDKQHAKDKKLADKKAKLADKEAAKNNKAANKRQSKDQKLADKQQAKDKKLADKKAKLADKEAAKNNKAANKQQSKDQKLADKQQAKDKKLADKKAKLADKEAAKNNKAANKQQSKDQKLADKQQAKDQKLAEKKAKLAKKMDPPSSFEESSIMEPVEVPIKPPTDIYVSLAHSNFSSAAAASTASTTASTPATTPATSTSYDKAAVSFQLDNANYQEPVNTISKAMLHRERQAAIWADLAMRRGLMCTTKQVSPEKDVSILFDIQDRIGKGHYGSVHLALPLNSELAAKADKFALKLISLKIPNVCMPLFEEVSNSYNITHPNIVRTFDSYFHNGDKLAISMEYVDGVNIAELMQNRKGLEEAQVAAICRELLQGLKCLHSRGLIHRDINPSNIMLSRQGEVKIVDFGASIVNKSWDTITGVAGTKGYAAPEMVRGESYNCNVDIYALGISIIKMIDNPPLGNGCRHAGDSKWLPVGPTKIQRPEVSYELREFMARCVSVHAEHRASAALLLDHTFLKKAAPLASLIPLVEAVMQTPPHISASTSTAKVPSTFSGDSH